jgi:hypothetical protein
LDSLFKQIGQVGKTARNAREEAELKAGQIMDSLFLEQQALLLDPHPYKSLRTPRRGGKSYAGAAAATWIQLMKPGANVLILGLTHDSVKKSFWFTLKAIWAKFGLEPQTNETQLSWSWPDGGRGVLAGAETKEKMERLRGWEMDLCVIDEAKSFTPDNIDYLIHDVVKPALMSRNGQLWSIGTPGSILDGAFYYATNPGIEDDTGRVHCSAFDPEEPCTKLWSFHTWTLRENTGNGVEADGTPKQWTRALFDKALNEWDDMHPTWRREYLGEWVQDDGAMVYAYLPLRAEGRVTWVPRGELGFGLPEGDWQLLLGVDFGFENPTAFVVAAASQQLREIREVHSERHQHLTLSQVAERIRLLERRFGGFVVTVVDGGAQGKMLYETLAQDYGIHVQPAEKTEKTSYIEAMNSDFHSGRVKLLHDSELANEMAALEWDLSLDSKAMLARRGKLRENPNQSNDLCDAFLYLWRRSIHRWETERHVEKTVGSSDWWADWDRAQAELYTARRTLSQDPDHDPSYLTFDNLPEGWN